LRGDWFSDYAEDGSDYYVIGWEAYAKAMELSTKPEISGKWGGPRPSLQQFFQAVVSAPEMDYLKEADKRLKEAGITRTEAAEIIKQQLLDDEPSDSVPASQSDAAFYLLDALMAERRDKTDHPLEYEEGELEDARDRLYLREIARKHKDLVEKLQRLEPLPFVDPQLQETTRCWLYGFYRAVVVLSACALEQNLKNALDIEDFEEGNFRLVEKTERGNVISDAHAEQARQTFWHRNRVVHQGWDVEAQDAETILANARGVISSIREALDSGSNG